ncbi:hypothetical protein CONLIGDRAFT_634769 [Coniochaeta ligniaria NRRL 30616]|uniref:Mediator of RNA polymerase II transcription subunit 9 n=1 Tax=Coniochaeta ligniaria NRRL 30616 TaxID=1408157 RepID=A0A1J7JB97_9PEZI|nr:hypothetical protein CONLIGDRAFT_634769 [Coniochaeta ligniaria NRRL 30616]
MSTPNSPLSPDAFSPLPELSTILSRLRPPPSSSNNPLASPAPASQPTPSAATPLPATASATGPLSLKEVPAATDPIKHKLQRARQQVKALPDIGRTVEEQEKEIEELTGRITQQKEVLRVLREVGIRFGVGDEEGGKKEESGEGEDRDMVMR